MMLTPCWPSAGPTGGAGEAWPPTACNLICVRTFFAIENLDLLDLIEPYLDRRLAPEDRDEDLQPLRVLVDLRDLAREVRQRARDDLHRLADRELGAAARPDFLLAVEQAV